MKTMMNTMTGARAPIVRKGNTFVVEINIEKKKEEFIVPMKIATKRWNSSRNMHVDEGELKVKNRYGALTVEDEEAYEAGSDSVSAGRGW